METTISIARVSQCNIPNKNNIMYSKEIFDKAIGEAFDRNGYIPVTVNQNNYYEGVNFPSFTVDLKDVIGKIKLIDDIEDSVINITPNDDNMLNMIDQLIKAGYRAGMRYVSGVSLDDNGIQNVTDNMKIISYDLLSPDQYLKSDLDK